MIAAVEFLRSISPRLHSDSMPDEMAIVLAQTGALDAYNARVADLRALAASDRLAEFSLDGNSQEAEIAGALATANDIDGSYATLLAQRQTLLDNSAFSGAMKTLTDNGFDRDTTDDEVIEALRTNPTDAAKDANEYLSHGTTGETSLRYQLGSHLIDLGVVSAIPTIQNPPPDPTDPLVTDLEFDDMQSATMAIELLLASFSLETAGLTGTANDGAIETALAGDQAAIDQAMVDRDSLEGLINAVNDELVDAKRLLTSRGLAGANVGTFSDAEIETAFMADEEVNRILDALTIVRSADASLLIAFDALAVLGLDAYSDDLSVAIPFVDQDQYNSLRIDRDRLLNTGIDPNEATSRLNDLGLDLSSTSAAEISQGALATALVDADLLGVLNNDRITLATSSDVDFSTSTDSSVVAAHERLSSIGLDITRSQVAFASLQTNEISILHDASFGEFTFGFTSASQEETVVAAYDASAAELEEQLESLNQFTDVTVSFNSDLSGQTGWLITFHDPAVFDVANVRVIVNAALAGDASDPAIAAGVLSADLTDVTLDSAIGQIAAALAARELSSESTLDELAAVTGLQATFAQMQAVQFPLTAYNANRILSFSYEDNQFFLGFNFEISGQSDPLDLSLLEKFLRDHVQLPESVSVDIDGLLQLGGTLAADFRLGLDLGNLEQGITFDDMFIELNNLTVEGKLLAQDLDLELGYGPLKGLIQDARIDLDAALSFAINNGGSTTASLAELRDQGFSLIDLTATKSTLDADLPVAVALNNTTAAQTDLKFHTDNLFGDLSDLISQLPSLDDIANLSIDQILAGIKSAVDFVETEALAHPDTIAAIPLLNDYLDTALADIRAGLAFVEELEGAQTQQLWHDADGGSIQLRFAGDTETFTLDIDANGPMTASMLEAAIDNLANFSSASITSEVDGQGTVDQPWKIRLKDSDGGIDTPELQVVSNDLVFHTNELWLDIDSGTVDFNLANDSETFSFVFDGSEVVSANSLANKLSSLASVSAQQISVDVTGAGTSADPWLINFTDSNGTRLPVPDLEHVLTSAQGAGGGPATVSYTATNSLATFTVECPMRKSFGIPPRAARWSFSLTATPIRSCSTSAIR